MKKIFLSTLFLFAVGFTSCEHETFVSSPDLPAIVDSVDCAEGLVDFQNEVLPLLVSKCGIPQCHDAQTAEDDIIIDSYENLLFGDEEALVIPNSPLQSKLYEVITENPNGEDFMPPSPNIALTSAEVDLIYTWISQGAENTICNSECDLSSVSYSQDIEPIVNTNCLGCHAGNSPSGDLLLTSYNEIKSAVSNRNLQETINYQSDFSVMPPNQQMNDCNIAKFAAWIDLGMPNN